MDIELLTFNANDTRWTLQAVVNGKLETITGGFVDGFPTYDGVDFRPLPIGRTTLAVDSLVRSLGGKNEGRAVPVKARARSLREAARLYSGRL